MTEERKSLPGPAHDYTQLDPGAWYFSDGTGRHWPVDMTEVDGPFGNKLHRATNICPDCFHPASAHYSPDHQGTYTFPNGTVATIGYVPMVACEVLGCGCETFDPVVNPERWG